MAMSEKFKRRPAGSKPKEELTELTKNIGPATSPKIQLVHITSAGIVSEILGLDPPWLKAFPCKVFDGQDRLYFFVMRPLLKLREGDANQALVSHFPAAFVMEADTLAPPVHVAPFDTGAASAGKYDSNHSPGSYLEDYFLDADLDAVKRFISWAYGSPGSCFSGSLRRELLAEIPNYMSVAHSWLRIAQQSAPSTEKDLRGAAIEIAYDRGFDFSTHVKLCILPDELLQDKRDNRKNEPLLKILNDNSIKYETYEMKIGTRPNYHLRLINEKLTDYYKSIGLLS
jgi:hypothetical protein